MDATYLIDFPANIIYLNNYNSLQKILSLTEFLNILVLKLSINRNNCEIALNS